MTTTIPTTEVAVVDPAFTDAERYALAAFLAGYRGLTRDAYALDLRQFIAWCEEHHVRLFAAAVRTSSASPETSKHVAGRGRQSPAGCARSPASTATPNRRPARTVPGGPRAPASPRLRVPRHRPGPQ